MDPRVPVGSVSKLLSCSKHHDPISFRTPNRAGNRCEPYDRHRRGYRCGAGRGRLGCGDHLLASLRCHHAVGEHAHRSRVVVDQVRSLAARAVAIEADLSDPASPTHIFDLVEDALGPVTALVMAHCQSVDSNIYNTSIASFDLHFAVNARATWLLIREFGLRYRGGHGNGRIISITSDHTVENLPYGASKGAMDRIVLAAAHELKALGVTANVINPGATDTGWMSEGQLQWQETRRPLGGLVCRKTAPIWSSFCAPKMGVGSMASCCTAMAASSRR